jgi:hypothetical protein
VGNPELRHRLSTAGDPSVTRREHSPDHRLGRAGPVLWALAPSILKPLMLRFNPASGACGRQ